MRRRGTVISCFSTRILRQALHPSPSQRVCIIAAWPNGCLARALAYLMQRLKSGIAIVRLYLSNLCHAIKVRCSCPLQLMKWHPAVSWQSQTCCPACLSLSRTERLSTSSAAAPRHWCLSCPFTGKEVNHVWAERRDELLCMPKVREHGTWHKRAV